MTIESLKVLEYSSYNLGCRSDEDRIVCLSPIENHPEMHFFAVFDGHGDDSVSNLCQNELLSVFLETEEFKEKNFRKAFTETFKKMDEICKERNLNGGSTALCVLITDSKVFIANTGDSRSFGKVKRKLKIMTKEHVVTVPKERKRIESTGGTISDGRVILPITFYTLNMTRAIGDLMFKPDSLSVKEHAIICLPDIYEYRLKEVDMIFLSSDGVWQEDQSGSKLVACLKNKENEFSKIPQILCDQVRLEAKSARPFDGHDDQSAILIAFLNGKTLEKWRDLNFF